MPLVQPVSKEDHIQGSPSATIELLEYGDYQCPHCGYAFPIVKEIQRQLGDKLRFIFRNFPLRKIHPQAMSAAIAGEAAALQGKFWEMHEMLIENQRRLNHDSIIEYAESIGLDIDQFTKDIKSHVLEDKVMSDFQGGLRSGVNATPTFFVNGEKYDGDWASQGFLVYLQNEP